MTRGLRPNRIKLAGPKAAKGIEPSSSQTVVTPSVSQVIAMRRSKLITPKQADAAMAIIDAFVTSRMSFGDVLAGVAPIVSASSPLMARRVEAIGFVFSVLERLAPTNKAFVCEVILLGVSPADFVHGVEGYVNTKRCENEGKARLAKAMEDLTNITNGATKGRRLDDKGRKA